MGRKEHSKHRSARLRAQLGRVERKIRQLIRGGRYHLSSHAYNKIAENEFLLEDVVHALLTGSVQSIRADELGAAVDGKKYIMFGHTTHGVLVGTVGKILRTDDGQLYFVITIF
jgi:hypothetical protein